MTESGERALKLYEELDGIAREFDNYDFGLSYSDEPRDKSLAIITQFEQAAFEAGRGQWISTESGDFPKVGTDVLAWKPMRGLQVVRYSNNSERHRKFIRRDGQWWDDGAQITHWMAVAPPDSGDAL